VEAVYSFIYNIIRAAEVPATGEVETAYTLAYNIEQAGETPATGEVEAAYELAVPPPSYVPYWIVTAAYVASSDPGWPRRSKAMMKSCVHEYGKSTFGSMDMRWSYNVGPYVWCVVSGDVDGDGALEVIVPQGHEYRFGSVYCLSGSDGSLKWSYSTGTADYFAVLSDIDGDGELEIMVGNYSGYLYCINSDGTLRWRYLASNIYIWAIPAVFDVDGDGASEIIFGDGNGFIYCLGPDGALKWSVRPAGAYTIYNISVADIDGDGAVELLASSDAGYCICLRGSDGSLKWSYNVGSYCEAATLFDVDGDGALEVLTNADNIHRFYCLEPNGTLKWYYTAGDYVYQVALAAYDIDGDGIVECLGGSGDFYVYCLVGPTGARKWRYYAGDDTACVPCLADLDNDGLMEAATCHGTVVFILEHDGTLKASLDIGTWVGYYATVALDDADGDKKLEILVPGNEGYAYCLGPA
jgi:outer membrane protein assembly factor BamB